MWFISGDVQLQRAWEIMRTTEDIFTTLETHAHSVPKMNNYPAKNAVFTGSNGNKYKKKWCLV
jgi:hypothetical protein